MEPRNENRILLLVVAVVAVIVLSNAGAFEATGLAVQGGQDKMVLNITVKDTGFIPVSIEIPAGTTLKWTNKGPTKHTITSLSGAFNSNTINKGDTFSFTFDKPGTFEYVSNTNRNIKGVVVVKEEELISAPAPSCEDTDKRNDQFVKGTVTNALGVNNAPSRLPPQYDTCTENGKLKQVSCMSGGISNDVIGFDTTPCPEGSSCKDGACVAKKSKIEIKRPAEKPTFTKSKKIFTPQTGFTLPAKIPAKKQVVVPPFSLLNKGANEQVASLRETREAMQKRLFQGGKKHALDATCKNNNECESSFCAPNGKCGAKFAGEACTLDEQCLTLFCAAKKCAQPKKAGELCSRPVACKTGLTCSNGKCVAPSAARPTVTTPPPTASPKTEPNKPSKKQRGYVCSNDNDCESNHCEVDNTLSKRCQGGAAAGASCKSSQDCKSKLFCDASKKCAVVAEEKQAPAAATLIDVPASERTKWPDGIRCEQVSPITLGPFAHVYSTAIFVHPPAKKTTIPNLGTLDAPLGTTGKLYLFNDKKENKFSTDVTMKSGVSIGSDFDRRALPPAWFGPNQGGVGIVEIVAGLSNNNFLGVRLLNAPRPGSMINTPTCRLCKNAAGANDCFKN